MALDRKDPKLFNKAIADHDHEIRLTTNGNEPVATRGLTYYCMERYEEALADYDRAIEMGPVEAWMLYGRGEAYEAIGREAEAKADFVRAAELGGDPEYADELAERLR